MGTPAREVETTRPDLEANEESSTAATHAADDEHSEHEHSEKTAGFIPFAAAGEVFTDWFNDKVKRLANPTIRLGAKTAMVIALHPDGRLECELPLETAQGAETETEQQFVAFDPIYLDMLLKKFAAAGV